MIFRGLEDSLDDPGLDLFHVLWKVSTLLVLLIFEILPLLDHCGHLNCVAIEPGKVMVPRVDLELVHCSVLGTASPELNELSGRNSQAFVPRAMPNCGIVKFMYLDSIFSSPT